MLRSNGALPTRGVNRRDAINVGLLTSTSMVLLPRAPRAPEATPDATPGPLTDQERGWLEPALQTNINGWIHLRVGGEPLARGFQHGYLVAAEYADAISLYEAMTYQAMGFNYAFFVEKAGQYHTWKIPPELTREMEGIAAGLTTAGVPTTIGDIIGWNAYTAMTGYWWPTVASQYVNSAPLGNCQSHCSAFIATGSATADGRVVINSSCASIRNGTGRRAACTAARASPGRSSTENRDRVSYHPDVVSARSE